MSTAARGLTAVTTETRFAAALTSRRASSSSGAISSRSASRTRSAPSMISPRCACMRDARAGKPRLDPLDARRSRTTARASSRSSVAIAASARSRSCSTALSRSRPTISRPTTTPSASTASAASASAERAERLRAREQVLDQLGDGEPEAERDEAAERRPEQRAPGKRRRRAARLRRNRQGAASGSGVTSTVPRPGGGLILGRARSAGATITCGSSSRKAAGLRWSLMRRRSPSRNCSARSRRMWGSADPAVRRRPQAPAGESAGSDSRRPRPRRS